jgi:hypothetical protein
MCYRDNPRWCLHESFLNFLEGWSIANGRYQLCGTDTVSLQARCKRVSEVTRMQNESIFPLLNKVRSHQVPSQGSATANDERLRSWIRGLEKSSKKSQGLSKCLDECWTDMALTGEVS